MMCEELETLHQIYFASLVEEIQAMEAALEEEFFSVEGQPSSEAGTDTMHTNTGESVASGMSDMSMALPEPSESQATSFRDTQHQEHCMAATITPSMSMIALAQRIQPDAELACSHMHHVQASIENTEALFPFLQFIAYGWSTADFLTLVVQDLKELSMGRSSISNAFVVAPGILQQTIANLEKGQEAQARLLEELLQVHEHTLLEGEVPTIIQQQTLGVEKLLTVLEGLKQLQELLEQQGEATSSNDRISENPYPPPPGGAGGAFPMSATLQGMQRPDCSTYSSGGNICSLQGLQCILSPTVEHAVQSLKTLVLQTQSRKDIAYYSHVSLVENGSSCPNSLSSRRSVCFSSSLQQKYRREPLRSLYDSDVQWNPKKRGQQNIGTPPSSAARLILTPLTLCNVGITCSHTTHPSKEYSGIEGGNALGLARAQTHVQSFSAAAVWNTDKQGITASLATCYGWGKTKNIRSIMERNGSMRTHGIPTTRLKGGLFQLGYNVLSNAMVWTVFVEAIHVRSRWNAYKETCSPFASQISTTKAIRQEKSVGIRSHWNISNTANVQMWFVKTYGRRKAKEISSLPYATSVQQLRLTLPAVTSTTSQKEIGISVTTTVSDTVEIRFQGATQYRQFRNMQQSYIHLLLQYLY